MRSEGDFITFKNLSSGQKVKQFRSFLQNSQNKTSIIKFIVDHWNKLSCQSKLQHKTLYVTCGKCCYKLTTDSAQEEELQSGQKEADTCLLLHARHVRKEPFNAIVISSEDTDVRILCLGFSKWHQSAAFPALRVTANGQIYRHRKNRLCHRSSSMQGFAWATSLYRL